MTLFSAFDQLLLELVNRARLDPLAEVKRVGIGLNDGLAAGTITAAAKQPLAANDLLVKAAEAHSLFMLNHDQFAHEGIGDGTPTSRMQAAGYTLTGSWMTGENIAWSGTTGSLSELAFTRQLHDNLIKSHDHRVNIMNGGFRELGTGVQQGQFTAQGTTYNAVMATEDFGLSGSKVFVTGVAITDANHNNFYDIGEGRSGIHVAVKTGAATASSSTEPAGGYTVATSAGSHIVTFSGAGLASSVSAIVQAGSLNVKVDLEGASKIASSATTTLAAGAKDLVLLGVASINGTGNALGNTITGGTGNNVLNGAVGNDTLQGGPGKDTLTGGAGNDHFVFKSVSEAGKTTSRDVITDFTHGIDKIDVSGIDANTALAGNQAFKFISTLAFDHHAGELHVTTAGSHRIVEGDVNGDGKADFQIDILGLKTITAADFVL
jgi:hypothetical protein